MTDPAPQKSVPAPRAWLGFVGVFALLTVAYFTIPLHQLGDHRPLLSWTLFVVVLTALAWLLMLRARDILLGTGRRPGLWLAFLICLSLYVFAATYFVLARHPGDFDGLGTRLDSVYFTVVTMSTIGYGDITAASQSARLVVILQVVYNFVFLAAAAGTLTRHVREGVESRIRSRGPGAAGDSGGADDTGGPEGAGA